MLSKIKSFFIKKPVPYVTHELIHPNDPRKVTPFLRRWMNLSKEELAVQCALQQQFIDSLIDQKMKTENLVKPEGVEGKHL